MPIARRTPKGGAGATRKQVAAPPQRPKLGITGSAGLGAPGAMPGGMRPLGRSMPPQLPRNLTALGGFGGMAQGGDMMNLGGVTRGPSNLTGLGGSAFGGNVMAPDMMQMGGTVRRGRAPVAPPSPGQEYGTR